MNRQYFSSRKGLRSLTLDQLYSNLQNLYLLLRDADCLKEKAHITTSDLPDTIRREAALALTFELFPIDKWSMADITEDHIFDAIEFLYDYVSKPGLRAWMIGETNYHYYDYGNYDGEAGRSDFRNKVNSFLVHYKSGYELAIDGMIQMRGTDGLQHILDADIIVFDELNVDSKVRKAIAKWKSRHVTQADMKESIRELADVFEWLKKTKRLDEVLDGRDSSALFEIANKFGIRHHDPKQKVNYDPAIWHSWIFHFYLATYHASIRLLIKQEQSQLQSNLGG